MKITVSNGTQTLSAEYSNPALEKEFGNVVEAVRAAFVTDTQEIMEISNPRSRELEVANQDKPEMYKGFLYIRCPSCGKIRGFCAITEIDGYFCPECKTKSPFEHKLVPLWVQCECGGKFKYQTNLTENMFDIPCLDCKAPVAVHYNAKRQAYQSIRFSYPRRQS